MQASNLTGHASRWFFQRSDSILTNRLNWGAGGKGSNSETSLKFSELLPLCEAPIRFFLSFTAFSATAMPPKCRETRASSSRVSSLRFEKMVL